jgi:hypothetical protein
MHLCVLFKMLSFSRSGSGVPAVRKVKVAPVGSVCSAVCPGGWFRVTGCQRHPVASRAEAICRVVRCPGWEMIVPDWGCGRLIVSCQVWMQIEVMRRQRQTESSTSP